MKILCVSPLLPVPANSGSRIRVFKLLEELSRTDEVDLVSIEPPGTPESDLAPLRAFCRHVDLAQPDGRSKARRRFRALGMALRGIPLAVRDVVTPDLQRLLRRMTAERDYDIVQIEESHSAPLLDAIAPGSRARTVLSLHNVAWLQSRRIYEHERSLRAKRQLLLTWLPMRFREAAWAARFDRIVTVSDVDRKELLALRNGLDIDVVPNGVDARNIRAFPWEGRGKNILFVGSMDYVPNVDGILYLARNVFPLVRARLPDCKLTIVGRAPPPEVLALAVTPGVSVHPDVKEVLPFYSDALAAGVFLRSGGGTRLKILEAMATGTPVVSTAVGCEGIDVRQGQDILVADRPADFADRLVEVMIDPALWSRLSANGIAMAAERYDWGVLARQLRETYLHVLQ